MESQSKIDRITEWFKSNGGQTHGAIHLLYSPEYGYHFVAKTRPLYPKETLCKCPSNLTLSYLNVHAATEPTLSQEPTPRRPPDCSSVCTSLLNKPRITKSTIGIFFLVEERLKGAESFWFPYIQLLPAESTMTTPLWFKDEEIAYLRGTNLLSNDTSFEQTSVGLQLESYRAQWKLAVGEIESCGESARDFTWELFLWAATIFSSRAFTSDLLSASNVLDVRESEPSSSYPILYPFLDIFNHRPNAKVGWDLRQNGDFSLIHLGDDNIEQGEQVFNNYADKGNEDLLMGFGFCIPNNPHDRVALRLGKVSSQTHCRLRRTLPTHWKSSTWNPYESVFYLSAAASPVPPLPPPPSDTTTSSMPSSSSFSRLSVMSMAVNDPRGRSDPNKTTSIVPAKLVQSVYVIMQEHYGAAEEAANTDVLGAADPSIRPTQPSPSPEEQKQQIIWSATIGLLRGQMENSLLGITRWDKENNNSDEQQEDWELLTAGAKAALVYRAGQVRILRAAIEELRGLDVSAEVSFTKGVES